MTTAERGLALAVAIGLYGLFSTPAPPGLGEVELAIAVCLIGAVGLRQMVWLGTGHLLLAPDLRPLELVGAVAFVYLLWVPLLVGIAGGCSGNDVIRDVVPLVYLFLPVLLVRVLSAGGPAQRHGVIRLIVAALALAGVAFAVRWWLQHDWGFGAVGRRAMGAGAGYVLNSPATLFAAIWLPLTAVDRLLERATGIAGKLGALAMALAGGLCLVAFAGAVHRMALTSAGLSFAVYALIRGRRSPALVLAALTFAGIALVLPGTPLPGTLDQFVQKSEAVGLNQRLAEAAEVFDQVGQSMASILFGTGWGGLIANPAVGGLRVSYTHTLASYIVLKGGLFGGLALLAYLGALAPSARALAHCRLPLALALLPCLAAGLAVHTSFKYLDFGLLLTVMALAGEGEPLRDPTG
ncbi:MAG: hypothetical protein GC191_11860 [Azospirillum sp.]|nr:hypothetical protein [Azospirillum sp.]